MSTCLVQLHSVPSQRVTEHLSVAVPSNPVVEGSLPQIMREGHLFLSDTASIQETPFDGPGAAVHFRDMKNKGATSFASFTLSSGNREEDREPLEYLSRMVDYIVLDARALFFRDWCAYIRWMRTISRRIALFIQASDGMPPDVLAAWVAKAVVDIGSKGIVFIDGPPTLFSDVQNQLERHAYGNGGGYIIPILRDTKLLELESIALECGRKWCAGLCVQADAQDGRYAIKECLREMLDKKKNLRSTLNTLGEQWPTLAEECLFLERALADGSISSHKKRLEDLIGEIEARCLGPQEEASLQFAKALLAKAPSDASRRWPFLSA